MNKRANESIQCSVNQCTHHYGMKNFCSLDVVSIGTHEASPTQDQCTDCKSFAL